MSRDFTDVPNTTVPYNNSIDSLELFIESIRDACDEMLTDEEAIAYIDSAIFDINSRTISGLKMKPITKLQPLDDLREVRTADIIGADVRECNNLILPFVVSRVKLREGFIDEYQTWVQTYLDTLTRYESGFNNGFFYHSVRSSNRNSTYIYAKKGFNDNNTEDVNFRRDEPWQ